MFVSGTFFLSALSSAVLPLISNCTLHLTASNDSLAMDFAWGDPIDGVNDTWTVPRRGCTPVPSITSFFYYNYFIGVEPDVNQDRQFCAVSSVHEDVLAFNVTYPFFASQAKGALVTNMSHELEHYSNGSIGLTVSSVLGQSGTSSLLFEPAGKGKAVQLRSSAEETVRSDLTRRPPSSVSAPSKNSTGVIAVDMSTIDWSIASGGASSGVLALSLAGRANAGNGTGRLFLDYGSDWPFSYTPELRSFYASSHFNLTMTNMSLWDAATSLRDVYSCFVVWDESVINSVSVALTLAGLQGCVVVSRPEQIAFLEAQGVAKERDFRGFFTGWADVDIIRWSYDQYFAKCSQDFIIWLGGECCTSIRPAVADFGVAQRAFFAGDLSTLPGSEEAKLANMIVGSASQFAVIVGWHSYVKGDLEATFTSLMSSHSARVHGLNTLPNLSFIHRMPLPQGYTFRQKPLCPAALTAATVNLTKVLSVAVQTDGLGLGTWTKPGRGEIPYAWEVTLNDVWLQPTLLMMFYEQATCNDRFVGALSGPGYMYPRAVPTATLPKLLQMADGFLQELDLHAMTIMDESHGQLQHNLPKDIVDAYFDNMPTAQAFYNGYRASNTFASRGNQIFLSHDYYLAPDRSDDLVLADLHSLATVNAVRPYLLLVHVREFSDMNRVKSIFDRLDDFVLLPSETFVEVAQTQPTFVERYLEE